MHKPCTVYVYASKSASDTNIFIYLYIIYITTALFCYVNSLETHALYHSLHFLVGCKLHFFVLWNDNKVESNVIYSTFDKYSY